MTRETCLRWLEEMDLFKIAQIPKLGVAGPQQFMSVTVQYAQTSERRYGKAIIAMLKHLTS